MIIFSKSFSVGVSFPVGASQGHMGNYNVIQDLTLYPSFNMLFDAVEITSLRDIRNRLHASVYFDGHHLFGRGGEGETETASGFGMVSVLSESLLKKNERVLKMWKSVGRKSIGRHYCETKRKGIKVECKEGDDFLLRLLTTDEVKLESGAEKEWLREFDSLCSFFVESRLLIDQRHYLQMQTFLSTMGTAHRNLLPNGFDLSLPDVYPKGWPVTQNMNDNSRGGSLDFYIFLLETQCNECIHLLTEINYLQFSALDDLFAVCIYRLWKCFCGPCIKTSDLSLYFFVLTRVCVIACTCLGIIKESIQLRDRGQETVGKIQGNNENHIM